MQPPAVASGAETGNALLDALAPRERDRVLGGATRQQLASGQVLAEPDLRMTSVYFVLAGLVSLITTLQDGSTVEMAAVGREGMVGLPVFLGDGLGNVGAVCQVQGEALSMEADEFRSHAAGPGSGSLSEVLHSYTNATLSQAWQEVACARLHPVENRLSRFLLMTRDRAGTDRFRVTQEFMSGMLGVHRPTLSVAAKALAAVGLIRYHRGALAIVDGTGLEASACECYAIITTVFDRFAENPHTAAS